MTTQTPDEISTNPKEISPNPNEISTNPSEIPPPPSSSPPSYHHQTLPSINAQLTIRTIPSAGLSFQLWPSSLSFLSFLSLSPLLPPSSRILELGSGTGLLGISLSALLPSHVTLTDLPLVLPNLHFNASSNSQIISSRGGSLSVRQLRWGVAEDIAEIGDFDAVVASDVVYYDHLVGPLLETIGALVKGEVVFWMAHMRRWRRTDRVFFRRARRLFDVSVVHADLPAEGARSGVCIYRFSARRRSPEGS